MNLGLNLEFAKTEGLDVASALSVAADAGYQYVEPYVFHPVSLDVNSHLSVRGESAYQHLHTKRDDAMLFRRALKNHNLQCSAMDAHATLLLPQIGVPYICGVIDFAARVECPIVMSDEGPVAIDWMPLDRAFDLMCFSIEPIIRHAKSCGVKFAIELHNALTAESEYLVKLLDRFGPDDLGVNFDTGNCYLAGNNPVEYLMKIADRVVHVHVKDIPQEMEAMRGSVTGTRVGCAAGDGLVPLASIVQVLSQVNYDGVLSVECDSLKDACRSRTYAEQLLQGPAVVVRKDASKSSTV